MSNNLLEKSIKDSVITLSDGSEHVLQKIVTFEINYLGNKRLVSDLHFKSGLILGRILPSGRNVDDDCLSVSKVDDPVSNIDLSTVKVGDTLITRDGEEIPWNKMVKAYDVGKRDYAIFSPKFRGEQYYYEDGRKDSYCCSDLDIVEIRRASKEERLKILKEMED